MANDYRSYGDVPRFQLDRRSGRSRLKKRCPQCGKDRCLTAYVDTKTGDEVGDDFGRCDHERTCGYDKRPTGKDVGDRELWVPNNEVRSAFKLPVQPNVVNFISYPEFAKTISPGINNIMFSFLSKYWGPALVSDIFRRYNVGTMDLWGWKGCSIFWQVDKEFICRTGKIMEYYIKQENDQWIDVKRVKDDANGGFPHVTYYHSLKGKDFLFKQCLFGEHLLNFFPEDIEINLVESEKTAIICSINRPDRLFMATGGLQNFRPEVMEAVRGRKMVAFPDKGSAFDIWKDKISKNLSGYKIRISDCLQKEEQISDGEDIADLIIKKKRDEILRKNNY